MRSEGPVKVSNPKGRYFLPLAVSVQRAPIGTLKAKGKLNDNLTVIGTDVILGLS
jgi:hypothetical protein